MCGMFRDHPRKRTVRERWDTPLLKFLYDQWRLKYFYFGLPGPEAADVKLWHEMIGRVVAFEVESGETADTRADIVELNRQLALLGIPYDVYCGPLEEVVLGGMDYDGRSLNIDEFVTLFNLDFCNSITGHVDTPQGRRFRRFEALREIVSFQRRLFRATGASRFVLLLTVRDEFHLGEMKRFVSNPDLPPQILSYVQAALRRTPLGQGDICRCTGLLKVFIFSCLRDYFRGQNVVSVFAPPVVHFGASKASHMMHLAVVCRMEAEHSAQVSDRQSTSDFLRMRVLRARESGIEVEHNVDGGSSEVTDPVSVARKYV
jgi:hypothetical protein